MSAHPRIETALRRIASGRVPISGGGFAPLSRHEMIELARMACLEFGMKFGATEAWRGAQRSRPYRRPRKVRLSARPVIAMPVVA